MSEKPPPAPVAAVAAGRPAREVWENAVGGRTFEVGSGADRCFVKWTPAASGIDLAGWHEEHQPLGTARALDLLADIPHADRLVVCRPGPDPVLPAALGSRPVTPGKAQSNVFACCLSSSSTVAS